MEKEVPFSFHEFTITPFEVPHDGTDNVGYRVEVDGKVFFTGSGVKPGEFIRVRITDTLEGDLVGVVEEGS